MGRNVIRNVDSVLKSRNITLLSRVCIDKAMVSPVVTYGYDSLTLKKAENKKKKRCFQIAMLKTLESPLNSKEIKPVNSTRNQP